MFYAIFTIGGVIVGFFFGAIYNLRSYDKGYDDGYANGARARDKYLKGEK